MPRRTHQMIKDNEIVSLRKNVVAAAIPSSFEEIEQISHRRPAGMAITFASSVPGDNLPVGKKGEKDSAGNLGVHRHLPRFFRG